MRSEVVIHLPNAIAAYTAKYVVSTSRNTIGRPGLCVGDISPIGHAIPPSILPGFIPDQRILNANGSVRRKVDIFDPDYWQIRYPKDKPYAELTAAPTDPDEWTKVSYLPFHEAHESIRIRSTKTGMDIMPVYKGDSISFRMTYGEGKSADLSWNTLSRVLG